MNLKVGLPLQAKSVRLLTPLINLLITVVIKTLLLKKDMMN